MNYEFIISKMNLEKLENKIDKYHFRCPICGDSQKDPNKKRGWLYKNNKYLFRCFNQCGILDFSEFVNRAFPHLKQFLISDEENKLEYKIEKFKEKEKEKEKDIIDVKEFKLKFFEELNDQVFKDLDDRCLQYCNSRLFPQNLIKTLKFCPLKFSTKYPFGEMLIFPFYAKDKIYGFQGRRIEEKRFYIYSQEGFKIYNIFNVDKKENVFIFESIIDSSYLKNSIAMLGSDINVNLAKSLQKKVFAFDNDETGIIKSLEKAKKGESIFIWPNKINYKDVNELIVKEQVKDRNFKQIQDMFNTNIYKGQEAVLKLTYKAKTNNWLKGKTYEKKEFSSIEKFIAKNPKLFNIE